MTTTDRGAARAAETGGAGAPSASRPPAGLEAALRSLPGRCAGCGAHTATQGCSCAGLKAKAAGQAITTAAHPNDRAAVEAAIRELAARGKPFSANDARQIHGVKGGVVGATFTALYKAEVIKPCGDETSTDAGTHGHRIYRWIGAAA